MKLTHKTILITGGTSGIGLELVRALATDNQIIIVSYKGALPVDLAGSANIQLYHADLASREALEAVVDRIQKGISVLDVLINNAAWQQTAEFTSDEFNYDGIQNEINLNFTAVCHLTYLFLPLLMNATHGIVVNMNSGLAITPKKESAVYCATKAAMDSLSRSLQYQLAQTPVTIQQVFLPLVETAMTQGRGSGKLAADDVAGRIVRGIEQGRAVNDIGKVKLLRILHALVPGLARAIMKNG
ncbi:MAG: SDR family NAD(P)-dependent oxidoreductase [Pseudomonadota bacterium]